MRWKKTLLTHFYNNFKIWNGSSSINLSREKKENIWICPPANSLKHNLIWRPKQFTTSPSRSIFLTQNQNPLIFHFIQPEPYQLPTKKNSMKIRSVKMREAHPPKGGRVSFCSVVWDQKAEHLVTASSSEASISIHNPLLPSAAPKILRHHRDGVTALALSPNSTCLASGSVDHSVKLYKFPGIIPV